MNPAELVQHYAEEAMVKGMIEWSKTGSFEVDPYEDLNALARVFSMLPREYAVHTEKALILPTNEQPNRVPWQFDKLNFTGELATYSAVSSPVSLGRKAINALCLTFEKVTLLPYEDRLQDVQLHVPVFAVQSIDRIAA